MARGSAFYAAKRRASSSSNAATFSADTVELTLIAHSIVAVCSLLVTSVTNSLLAGCASLLLGMLYQSRPARRPSAAAQRSNAEEEDASVPRWDRRSLGGLSEGKQAELGPERGAGSVSPDEPFTLVRAYGESLTHELGMVGVIHVSTERDEDAVHAVAGHSLEHAEVVGIAVVPAANLPVALRLQ